MQNMGKYSVCAEEVRSNKMIFESSKYDLKYDQAGLTISSKAKDTYFLWAQSDDCYECDLLNWANVTPGGRTYVTFDTTQKYDLELINQYNLTLCNYTNVAFEENGQYGWDVREFSCSDIYTISTSPSSFISLLGAICLSLFFFTYCFMKRVFANRQEYQLRQQHDSEHAEEIEGEISTAEGTRSDATPLIRISVIKTRVVSLDAFRGITIALMIFVNYGGGRYWFFEHSAWNGLTFADVVFPWFVWIMGVCVPMKIRRELRSSKTRTDLFCHVALRSATLLVLGVILTNFNNIDLAHIRLPGVLQRLALSYFVCASLETYFMNPQPLLQNPRLQFIEDLVECWPQWLVVICLMVLHTLITFWLPVPGCPTGYIGPGGLHDHSAHYNCTGGSAGYIDRLLLGPNRLYQNPTCRVLYKCDVPYDPEGLVGILPTILCAYLGAQAGRILLVYNSNTMRISRWLVWSAIMISVASVLCNFSKEGGIIPLNKNLWSLSYVLFTSGLAFLIITVLYIVIDKKSWWSGTLFVEAGMNAILLYGLHIVFRQTFPWQWKVYNTNRHLEYLIMNIWAVFLWLLIAVVMHRYDFFVTV